MEKLTFCSALICWAAAHGVHKSPSTSCKLLCVVVVNVLSMSKRSGIRCFVSIIESLIVKEQHRREYFLWVETLTHSTSTCTYDWKASTCFLKSAAAFPSETARTSEPGVLPAFLTFRKCLLKSMSYFVKTTMTAIFTWICINLSNPIEIRIKLTCNSKR